MATTRRDFVKGMAATGGITAAGLPASLLRGIRPAAAPKRILILGGTGFIGPHQVRYAVARGHRVTVFNRGRTEGQVPEGVERLHGDRNGDLESLKGRTWDVVIDNPTTLPRWVRDAGQILQGNTSQYIFVSTLSVYASWATPDMRETAPLATMEDPTDEDTRRFYGPLKALSEREAERWYPGRATIIRPGLIVGPGDGTDRFTYWPMRFVRGGEILAPGDRSDPVQIIDARDLSEFIIRMAEGGHTGIYNTVGPRSPLTLGEMLAGIRATISGSTEIRMTWVDAEFLAGQNVRPWSDMPVWMPPGTERRGWSRVNIDRALEKGLTFRPLADTTRDTIVWFTSLPADRQATLKAGLLANREAEVLAAWRARSPGF